MATESLFESGEGAAMLNAFINSKEGQRFIEVIDDAAKYTMKHGKGGLTLRQALYLRSLDPWLSVWNAYDLGFRQGHILAKKEAEEADETATI